MVKVKVTQIKSPIGRNITQKKTLIGMGLNKINRTKIYDDSPSMRGMIEKVKHLLKIEQK
ncbi:MAG: 50S ribosomal protein L30 [Rickettsiales bacterium]|nr:50S ribosomal protein L30 [Rickettsiales bacterium]|tara:strand:- start:40508 stop:40687 length:180 start_codon:yes stop_codon:yes gene_type:complete